MSPQLPSKCSLEQLRKQAKDLRSAFAAAEPEAGRRVRAFFPDMQASSPLGLSQAHLVIARESGFRGWSQLVAELRKKEGSPKGTLHDEGRVFLKGIERLRWGKGRDNTFINCLRLVAGALGDEVSYNYLMGVSGAAFRVQLCQPEWCPSASDAGCGFDCTETAAQAIGYEMEPIHCGKDDPRRESVLREIIASIDRGCPVIGMQLVGPPDYGLVVGYTQSGGSLLCRTYYDRGAEYDENESWPWITFFVRNRHDPPDAASRLRDSLGQAVHLARTESFRRHDGALYLSGEAALAAWAAQLMEDERFDPSRRDVGRAIHTNAWGWRCLLDSRQAAAGFLDEVSAQAPSESRSHLALARSQYEEACNRLRKASKYAPYPWQLSQPVLKREWREALSATLNRVSDLEREAVRQLEAAARCF